MALTNAEEARIHDLECRTSVVERTVACTDVNLAHLIKRLDSLSIWLRGLVITLIPCTLGGIGFLAWEVLRR